MSLNMFPIKTNNEASLSQNQDECSYSHANQNCYLYLYNMIEYNNRFEDSLQNYFLKNVIKT